MKSLDDLRAEHDGIKVMLNILSAIMDQAGNVEKINTKHLDQLMEFITVFVDKCHHGKEEDLLFPALVKAGVPQQNGPVGIMLMEHDTGRKLVQAMADSLTSYKGGDKKAMLEFANNARQYITMLNEHINKENNILYPMAENQLDDATDKRLYEGFESIERERIGEGKHQQFHEMLHSLKARYL